LYQSSTGDQAITHQAEVRQKAGRKRFAQHACGRRGDALPLFPDGPAIAHKAQHIKPARSKDKMLSVSRLKLPAFFRPSSWPGASSLSYFPDIRSLL
jgi:hypothetical protein